MCGRSYDPRFIFAWPNNRISVMGGAQAAGVFKVITEDQWRKRGLPIDEKAKAQIDQMVKIGGIEEQIDRESTALFGTARLWDDGIIDPRDSRRLIAELLSICFHSQQVQLQPNTFGIARM